MKKILLFGLLGLTLFIQPSSQTIPLTFTRKIAVRSQYLGTTNAFSIYDGTVIQPSLTISSGHFYFVPWFSFTPKGHWDQNYGSEYDLIVGYSGQRQTVAYDLSYSYFNLIPLNTSRGDLHSVILSLAQTAGRLRPFLDLEWDVPQTKRLLSGGLSYRIGLNQPLHLDHKLWTIQLSGSGHDGVYGHRVERLSSLRLKLSTDYRIGSVTVSPELVAQKRIGYQLSNGGIARDALVASIVFTEELK